MRVLLTIVTMACMGLTGWVVAQEAEGKPAEGTPFLMPTASMPAVVAKVGDVEIKSYEVERFLLTAPQGQMGQMSRSDIAKMLIGRELIRHYLKTNKIAATDEDMKPKLAELEATAKKTELSVDEVLLIRNMTLQDFRDQIAIEKLIKQRVEDKADEFIAKNPAAFNGTTVKASHILIKVDPTEPTADQLAAKKRLEEIRAEIKAGKITFAEAAKKNSDDGSAANGGDLGPEFTFDNMVFPFAQAAFATKVGEISGIVQSQYGFHVILVTGRTEGKEKVDGDRAKFNARQILMSQLQTEVFTQPANGVKVEVFIKEPEMPAMFLQDNMPE